MVSHASVRAVVTSVAHFSAKENNSSDRKRAIARQLFNEFFPVKMYKFFIPFESTHTQKKAITHSVLKRNQNSSLLISFGGGGGGTTFTHREPTMKP